MLVLISNVGSTSLKFKLYDMPSEHVLCDAKIERIGSLNGIYHYKNDENDKEHNEHDIPLKDYQSGINLFIKDLCDKELGVIQDVNEIEAIGFKTVISKGFNGTVELNEEVMKGMKDYLFIAPVHNAAYIGAIEEFKTILGSIPMIGVFETSFHRTIPLKNKLYPIPYEWYEKYGIAKNGYHGASFTYIANKARKDGDYKYIIGCHLGGSSSICAIKDGKSYDSSFGFSLQTGLPHMNRSGDCDPYIALFLENEGLSKEEIIEGLAHKGGLQGMSGYNDFREIEAAAIKGEQRAKLAIDVFVNDIVRYIGSFYAEMGGFDKLVFTGGIGENSKLVRSGVAKALECFGIKIDENKNNNIPVDGYISSDDSKVKIQVIAANEELGIAIETYNYINSKKNA